MYNYLNLVMHGMQQSSLSLIHIALECYLDKNIQTARQNLMSEKLCKELQEEEKEKCSTIWIYKNGIVYSNAF